MSATNRWIVERTNSWYNAHKKLVWCSERRGPVIDLWVAFSEVVIIVKRLIREGWSRYRVERADLPADHDLLAQPLIHSLPRSISSQIAVEADGTSRPCKDHYSVGLQQPRE